MLVPVVHMAQPCDSRVFADSTTMGNTQRPICLVLESSTTPAFVALSSVYTRPLKQSPSPSSAKRAPAAQVRPPWYS